MIAPRSAILLALALTAAPCHAEVREISREAPYLVYGTTVSEVADSLWARRPTSYDGDTRWYVKWSYAYRQVAGGCAIGTVSTVLFITTSVPELVTANAGLAKAFNGYLARLRIHEAGHAQNGRSVARHIDKALASLPPEASCSMLGARADATARYFITEGNALDESYDRQTGHGRLQGAEW